MTFSNEPISPELALVCPEFADYARQRLPKHPWQLVIVKPLPPPSALSLEEVPRLPRWAAVALYIVIATGARVAVALAVGAALVLALTLLGAS